MMEHPNSKGQNIKQQIIQNNIFCSQKQVLIIKSFPQPIRNLFSKPQTGISILFILVNARRKSPRIQSFFLASDKNIYKQHQPQSGHCKINKIISTHKHLMIKSYFLTQLLKKSIRHFYICSEAAYFYFFLSILRLGKIKLAVGISANFLSILTTAPVIISFSLLAKLSLNGQKPMFSFVSKELTGTSISERLIDS